MTPIIVDFETGAIRPRPFYPPTPVGVAIKWPGKPGAYLAWGHPTRNNCSLEQGKAELEAAWNSGLPLCFHNAKFDLDVAYSLGMPSLPWERLHDTMFLLFLRNPHAASFALKKACEELLGLPPEEQAEVRAWLIDHRVVRSNEKDWGAHICDAPGDLVGRYAVGDVERTAELWDLLHPWVVEHGMEAAYARERELLPILLRNEQEGLRVDAWGLLLDVEMYSENLQKTDRWLRERLGVEGLNIDADEQLAAALDASGVVQQWQLTRTGQRSVAKDALLPSMFSDPRVAQCLGYRNRLATCLNTFMVPWLEQASVSGGRIHTSWNQVRQIGRGASGMAGARTGRLSSAPNFQNLPKNWTDKNDGYEHPEFLDVAPLPMVRKYILPDDGDSWFVHRDFNQQELRILAHYENDQLASEYQNSTTADMHTFVQRTIEELTGLKLERRAVKVLNFGLVYGMGLGKLAEKMGISEDEARAIKAAQRKAIPGLARLEAGTKARGRANEPIRTWGGRVYYVEPAKLIDGELRSFEYKLLNYLIQGSAADCTKQAICNYARAGKHGRFLVTVHDEINLSVPKEHLATEMRVLDEAMGSVGFDVPMLSDGKYGPSWAEMQDYDDVP